MLLVHVHDSFVIPLANLCTVISFLWTQYDANTSEMMPTIKY